MSNDSPKLICEFCVPWNNFEAEGIMYEEYCQLCSYFLKKGDYKHLVMTMFEWNLMCCVNQLNSLTTTCSRIEMYNIQTEDLI